MVQNCDSTVKGGKIHKILRNPFLPMKNHRKLQTWIYRQMVKNFIQNLQKFSYIVGNTAFWQIISKTDQWSNSVVPIKFHKKCQSQGEISHFFKLSVLAFFTLSMTYRFRVLPGLKGVSTFEFALVQNDLTCKNFCELLNFSELCPCLNFFQKTNNVDSSQKSPCM